MKEDDASESSCFSPPKPEGLTKWEWIWIAVALFGLLMFIIELKTGGLISVHISNWTKQMD